MNILARQIISGEKSPKVQGLDCRVIASTSDELSLKRPFSRLRRLRPLRLKLQRFAR
jgi:hypothetical protein